MKRVALFCFLALNFSVGAQGQAVQCGISSSGLEVRGFKLGMTKDQVTARQTEDIGEMNDVGVSSIRIYPRSLKDENARQGIRLVALEFLDEKATILFIQYDSNADFEGVDEFAAKVSEGLKIPNAWVTLNGIPDDHALYALNFINARKMECKDFKIFAGYDHEINASLMLVVNGLRDKKEQRKADLEKKRREAFKP